MLPEIIKNMIDPTIFWLDGHYSCGITAKGDVDVPLLEELIAINVLFKGSAILIIDDYRLFGQQRVLIGQK